MDRTHAVARPPATDEPAIIRRGESDRRQISAGLRAELGDAMGKARYFAAGGGWMNDALLRRAHDHRLGFAQGGKGLPAIACWHGFRHPPNAAAHFLPPGLMYPGS